MKRRIITSRFDSRVICSLLLLALLPAGTASGQVSQSNDNRYVSSCRPPLKLMAGACVPRCYAGYEDRGDWCELKRMGSGGGGN
jgi:hypothetical protein